jgi:hypothetical protein
VHGASGPVLAALQIIVFIFNVSLEENKQMRIMISREGKKNSALMANLHLIQPSDCIPPHCHRQLTPMINRKDFHSPSLQYQLNGIQQPDQKNYEY